MQLADISAPDHNWKGARVLVRADLNVPLDRGRITDDARIAASVATIRELRNSGAAVAVCSHLGRPGGVHSDDESLAPCATRLAQLLSTRVELLDDFDEPGHQVFHGNKVIAGLR